MPGTFDGSSSHADSLTDVVAMDGLGILGTLGFFVPAALLIVLVTLAVVRDRRLSARDAAAEADEAAFKREEIPGPPPRTD